MSYLKEDWPAILSFVGFAILVIMLGVFLVSVEPTQEEKYNTAIDRFEEKKALCKSEGYCVSYTYGLNKLNGKSVPYFEACVPCGTAETE